MMTESKWIKTDGGRHEYFSGKADAGDCGVRAMAIALEIDYKSCYAELAEANKEHTGKKTARGGLHKKVLDQVLKRHGWQWHSAPKFEGRKARCEDMPEGWVIARMARHFAAINNGNLHDSFDARDKMIYGYWQKA